MQIAGFDFTVEEIGGCRIIEGKYPHAVDVSKLSAVIASYYDLWDDETPTAALTGIEALEDLSPVREILTSVIQRTVLQSSFVGSAWYTGPRPHVAEELRALLRDAGRPDNNVFESRDEAVRFLGDLCERRQSATQDP